MTSFRSWAALASVGLAVSAATVASGVPAAASTSGRMAVAGSLTPSVERAKPLGHVASGNQVSFDLVLNLRDAAGAKALVNAVSDPASAQYRHYLTDAQWIARYAPTQASVASAETWLRQQGFKVGSVPADRLFVSAQGSAAQVESAFGTTLGNFKVNEPHAPSREQRAVDPDLDRRDRLRRDRRERGDRNPRAVERCRVGGRNRDSPLGRGAAAACGFPQSAAVQRVLGPED